MAKKANITEKAMSGMKDIISAGAEIAKKSPLGRIDGIASVLDNVGEHSRGPSVGVLIGSPSDWEIMKGAIDVLKEMGVSNEVLIASAHRTPKKVEDYASSARARGVEVIIAGAGMAAHLAGAVAANTTLPVIGVPIKTGALNGVDALYSTVQMPTGIPVATVAIDGAKNAAFLACSILSIKHSQIAERLESHRKQTGEKLEKQAAELVKKHGG